MTRKTTLTRAVLSLSVLTLAISGGLLFAGPLDPPAGPVAPTYKTLTEVEPRIAISAANTPGDANSLFRITQPGSYYLTGNITGVSGKHGIEIASANVAIDLNGFTLTGVPGSLSGIVADPFLDNLTIRNGAVTRWGDSGIFLGVVAAPVVPGYGGVIESVTASSNGRFGLVAQLGMTVRACTANKNTDSGIVTAFGCTITGCSAFNNFGAGFSLSIGCTMTDCNGSGNSGFGIDAAEGCTVSHCTAKNSQSGGGIRTGNGCTVTGCTTTGNTNITAGNGIFVGRGCTVSGCTATANASGIATTGESSITGCTVEFNDYDGIVILGSNSRITDNVCASNGSVNGAGIYTNGSRNRIEGNTVMQNDFGIYLFGSVTGNFVVRNHVAGNGTNFVNPAAGNFIGTPISTNAGMNSATNSLVNISF